MTLMVELPSLEQSPASNTRMPAALCCPPSSLQAQEGRGFSGEAQLARPQLAGLQRVTSSV